MNQTLPTLDVVSQRVCRVLIVDDHQLFRNGLADLIASESGVAVVGEAGDAAEAIEKFRSLQPDLVTLDISLAKGNGLDLVERLKSLQPEVLILIVSMFDDSSYADRALAAGANGYVCKQAANEEILKALRTVRGKSVYLSQPAMDRILQRRGSASASQAEEEQLSTRELQIFTLIGQGETTQRIAQQLNLAPSTVETYRERIKSKLNLTSGAELTRRAILWTLRST